MILFVKHYKYSFISLILLTQLACSELTVESNDELETSTISVTDNLYISAFNHFQIKFPEVIKFKKSLITEYGLHKKSRRIIVSFGPDLPDTTVFTVQIADKESYDEISSLGSVNIFNTAKNNSIRDDFAEYFFDSIIKNIKIKNIHYKKLLLNHFKFKNKDVIYAVFEQIFDERENKPERYFIFYLTEIKNKGVLVWLQIPITDNNTDSRSKDALMNRTWSVQNNFFNSIVVTSQEN